MGTQSQVAEPVVVCPKCGNTIPLTKALTSQVEAQVERRLEAQYVVRERELGEAYRKQLAETEKKAAAKARSVQALEMAELKEQIQEQQAHIAEFQRTELDLRKRARDLESKEKSLTLEVERRLQERAKAVEAETTVRVTEQFRLKDMQREKQLVDLRVQLDEANRRAQQGSQQLQGEVAEKDLEAQLRQAFPLDQIEIIATGQRGADVLHKVVDSAGRVCGSVLYEVKNTKAFQEAWLPKLREDQRAIGANIAVLVSSSLPKDVNHFAQRGETWVTGQGTCLCLAYVLKACIIEANRARIVAEGHSEKQAALVAYCGGVEFRQRVEALLEAITGLNSDLIRERRGLEAAWARRTKRHEQLLCAAAGVWGDIGGIIGVLPQLRKLELHPGDGEEQAA